MKKTLFFLAALLTFGLAANAQITTFPWLQDFEGGALPEDFTFIDSDGDGNNWQYSGQLTAHSGTGLIYSQSYINNVGALNPDNWMILPAFTLPSDASDLKFSWWVRGQDANYAAEYYSVYIATTYDSLADFLATTAVYAGTATGEYVKHGVDLASYAGQTIYVAFRHHNVTDMFYLNIDDIRIGGPELPELSVTGPALVSMNASTSYTAASDENTLTWYVDDVQQSATGHTFTTTFTTPGNHVVKAEATNVAGTNTKSVTTYAYDPANTCSRNTLLEHFTTQVCQFCPGGHERLGQAMEGFEDRIAWVAHHAGYYTDDMTIDASANDIIVMYGTGGTWAPAMMLDRNVKFADPEDGGAVASISSNVNNIVSLFNQALAERTFVTLDIDNVAYNQSSRELSLTVSGTVLQDFGDYNISLYITEDSIIAAQQSTGGQTISAYQHDHVLRAAVNGSWGERLSINGDNTYSKTFTYTLPATWKANKCRAIVFVNRYGNSIDSRQVLNVKKTRYLTDPLLTIANVEATMTIKTWPNPATEVVYIDAESTIHNYAVVNAMGQKVMAADVNADVLELDVRSLAAGVYFVSVTTDNGTATQRLSVVK